MGVGLSIPLFYVREGWLGEHFCTEPELEYRQVDDYDDGDEAYDVAEDYWRDHHK